MATPFLTHVQKSCFCFLAQQQHAADGSRSVDGATARAAAIEASAAADAADAEIGPALSALPGRELPAALGGGGLPRSKGLPARAVSTGDLTLMGGGGGGALGAGGGAVSSGLLSPLSASLDNAMLPGVEKNKPPSAPLADRNPFGWILCVSEVTQRDEDLFSTLQSLRGGADATDGSGAVVTSLSSHDVLSPPPSSRSELGREEPTLWTCCVGKTLSQATYHLSDSNETVWRLFSLLESRLEAEQRRAS